MASKEESTEIRKGDPPQRLPGGAKVVKGDPPKLRVAANKPEENRQRPGLAKYLFFAYSSPVIPTVVFIASIYVSNADLSAALQRCLFLLLSLPCVGSGLLSTVSLLEIKVDDDDSFSIFPGAFLGLLGSFLVGGILMLRLLLVGVTIGCG